MNLKCIMLNETNQMQKTKKCMILFAQNSHQANKSIVTEKNLQHQKKLGLGLGLKRKKMDEWFPGLGDREEDGLQGVHVLVDKKYSILCLW